MKTKIALSIFIILLLATTPAFFTTGCWEKLAADEELKVENGFMVGEIAEQIQQKKGNVEDYSCIIHLDLFLDEEALEREFEVMRRKPDMYRILTKESGKEPEKVEVSDGKYIWIYYPWRNTAIKVELPKSFGSEISESEVNEFAEKEFGKNCCMRAIEGQFIEGLMKKNGIFLLGTEEINGRTAYLLGKNPEDKGEEKEEEVGKGEGRKDRALPRYREKFWIDKATGILLRYEAYDSSENLILKLETRDLETNADIPDSEFEFEIPEGVKVETIEFGKYYSSSENLTDPEVDGQIASSFIKSLCL